MIQIPYAIGDSRIPGAGKGFFAAARIPAGKVLVAPGNIGSTLSIESLFLPENAVYADASIRWFESQCTVSQDWPDECYVNHSFQPNALWHLGFLFSLGTIEPGEEITMDYSHIIAPGHEMPFQDSTTGRPVIGLSWETSLLQTTEQLLSLAKSLAAREPLSHTDH